MTAFVLVHGSGQNSGCWSAVAERLRARGHVVATPDLPKQAATWTLEDHAALIACAAPGPGAVLVAHSFSGIFLPLVAQAVDCSLLVFFAAVVPEPGKSVRQQFAEDPTMFNPRWIEAGARWFDKTQVQDLATEFLFHDCDEETLAAGLRHLEMYDTRQLVVQPCPLAAWPDVPVASVVATEDRTISAEWGRRLTRRVLRVEPIEVRAGHCPHVSQPEATAELLDRLAREVPGRGAR